MQSQSKSISQKIENLRQRFQARKRHGNSSQLEERKSDAEIVKLKEILEELTHKIQHAQSKEILQAKVEFI